MNGAAPWPTIDTTIDATVDTTIGTTIDATSDSTINARIYTAIDTTIDTTSLMIKSAEWMLFLFRIRIVQGSAERVNSWVGRLGV